VLALELVQQHFCLVRLALGHRAPRSIHQL